jgi:hypothetical protein
MPAKARSARERRRVDRFPSDFLERKFRAGTGIQANKETQESGGCEVKIDVTEHQYFLTMEISCPERPDVRAPRQTQQSDSRISRSWPSRGIPLELAEQTSRRIAFGRFDFGPDVKRWTELGCWRICRAGFQST